MSDLINREDALMCATGEVPEGGTYEDALKMVAKRLQMLPPVKPEPVDVLRDEIIDETFKHLMDNY